MSEKDRLHEYRERKSNWKHWGPYLSERSWGTVREDYSENGDAWNFFPFEDAHKRAYRWGEDGLAGISDRNQYLCFALALWNGNDPILKERLYGLAGPQGNHGEDVKELYYYLDSTPTHSYMKMLYKYPKSAYPYEELKTENAKRGYLDPEYELLDTGIFEHNNYFDVFVEYANYGENDTLIKITVENRSDEAQTLSVIPTLWFRNTWEWGYPAGPMGDVPFKPSITPKEGALFAEHCQLGNYSLSFDGSPEPLFTENSTGGTYQKDAFNRYIIENDFKAVNPDKQGTKAALHYQLNIPAKGKKVIKLRLSDDNCPVEFDDVMKKRIKEADEFYALVQSDTLRPEEIKVQRQAFAGLLWSKQLYYYDVEQWLQGDPAMPTPSEKRKEGRNHSWENMVCFDIISMPDKWEYPWFASWDLAFHCISLVMVDPDYAKRMLTLLTREWYLHPNGQIPAYEWEFSDANPPVHAWAALRVYKIDQKITGNYDISFLMEIYNKLLLNFTWWVNRKDASGRNIFEGGFLGLDNISIFDRSSAMPDGGTLEQADGTSWMCFFCLNMMKLGLEIAKFEPTYQDTAFKFFEHFLRISKAMNDCGGQGYSLWNEDKKFFFDALHFPDGRIVPIEVHSLVSLLPLLAVETIEEDMLEAMPIFKRRMHWFINNKPQFANHVACTKTPGVGKRRLTSIITKEQLREVLKVMLDEEKFLSPHGIRSISKFHEKHPYELDIDGKKFSINYQPAESESGLFGGNSNWRGPVWMPLNFLIIESLQKYNHYYGEEFQVEFPTGSGNFIHLKDVAHELSRRLCHLFLPKSDGKRPIYGDIKQYKEDPHFKELLLFNEYFNGDTGYGLGASHQTGWSALIAKLLQQSSEVRRKRDERSTK